MPRRPPRIPKAMPQHVRRVRPDMSRAHLDMVKLLPCLVCGRPADDPHHLLHADHGPNGRGMGRKQADRWAIPVDREHHEEAHAAGDDEAYFSAKGIDARAVADALWAARGDLAAMKRIVFRARQNATLLQNGIML